VSDHPPEGDDAAPGVDRRARLRIGQLVNHKLFDYRGVIVDVDATFEGTEEWYQTMARTRPPKDKPWYHVLVHDAQHMTYVSERNLQPDLSGEPISHPALELYFGELRDGLYRPRQKAN
jgi:heat shock protein HspQ